MQVGTGEGGVNAVSRHRRQAFVIKRGRRSLCLSITGKGETLWVELFLVGLERPATLSESHDVSTLDRILLREFMCEAVSW